MTPTEKRTVQERLRETADYFLKRYMPFNAKNMTEAADRIDALEKALKEQSLFLRGVAMVMTQWAKESRDGGWSTHQVEVNQKQAGILLLHASIIDELVARSALHPSDDEEAQAGSMK